VYFFEKSKMGASSHGSRWMTIKEVLEEMFTDRDSELKQEESEDVSECNGDSSGSEDDDESGEEVASF